MFSKLMTYLSPKGRLPAQPEPYPKAQVSEVVIGEPKMGSIVGDYFEGGLMDNDDDKQEMVVGRYGPIYNVDFKKNLRKYREPYMRSIGKDLDDEDRESVDYFGSNYEIMEPGGSVLRKPEKEYYWSDCIRVDFYFERSKEGDHDPIWIPAKLDTCKEFNLMPLSVYIEKGLSGMLHSTEELQFADGSRKIAEGALRDVIIRVGDLRYTLDFIIVDTTPTCGNNEETMVLLGMPFIATSGVTVNYYDRTLTFYAWDRMLDRSMFKEVDTPDKPSRPIYVPKWTANTWEGYGYEDGGLLVEDEGYYGENMQEGLDDGWDA